MSAYGELTGDGARQEGWHRMPVLNTQESVTFKNGQFVSRVANYDPVIKYCQGVQKINVVAPDHIVHEKEKMLAPFFLETDQIQTLTSEFSWDPGFRFLKGSHRLELSCFGWEGAMPEPEAQIPVPEAPCRSLESRCDQLCPSTDSELRSCLNPGVRLKFSPQRGLSKVLEEGIWTVGLTLPHNHGGEQALSCSFEVSLPSQKPGSTTVLVKTIGLKSRSVVAGAAYTDQFTTRKTAYEILWDQAKVKGVCSREPLEKPFEFCHPGLRYECNFVSNIQD